MNICNNLVYCFVVLIPGHFYAPEQSDERILTLSSDQSKNTVLISGDTAGWLQVWDISHYGLDIQPQVRFGMFACRKRVDWIFPVHDVLFWFAGSVWAAPSTALLEGTYKSINVCGSPWDGWKTLYPDSFSWWLCWAVDHRWRPCGVFWTGSTVECLRPVHLSDHQVYNFVPVIGLSISMLSGERYH